MNNEDAYQLGKAAYQSGEPLAPALDPKLMKGLKEKVGENSAALKAWHKGWIEANLNDGLLNHRSE